MPIRILTCALLALSLVACGGGSDDPVTTPSGGEVTSGGAAPVLNLDMPLARLMSGDVVVAARIDVAHVRGSSLYPRAVALLREGQADQAEADFAVALVEKTTELGFAGGIDDEGPDPHLTILRGQFEQSDFERFAAMRPDAVAGEHAGVPVFTAGNDSLTLVGGRIFLLGSTETVNEALDRLAQREPTPEGVATRLLDDASLSAAPIAIAFVAFDDLRASIAEMSRAPRELRSLVGGSLVVDLSTGLAATGIADVGSEAAATGLRNRLRSELSSPMARLGLGALGLSSLLTAVQISATGNTAQVQMNLDAAQLAQVVNALEGVLAQYVQEASD